MMSFLKRANRMRRRIQMALLGDPAPHWRARLVFDRAIALGFPGKSAASYCVDLDKEALSRKYVLDEIPRRFPGRRLRFLDVGGRDGELVYLLGATAPLEFNAELQATNKKKFDSLYEYFGVDLHPAGANVLFGDLCDLGFLETYRDHVGRFDVIYSNNVFEHFAKPWIAAEIILALLRPGGICITVVPFAQRYHESPGDYFRYTHQGVPKLFEAAGPVRILEAGYDIRARRYDWQGAGNANDLVPVDHYGAWRETWFAVSILEKLPLGND